MATAPLDMELLTVAEAAELLKVSAVTLRRWLRQGRLPAYRLGPRQVRVRRGDLAALLVRQQPAEVRQPAPEMRIATALEEALRPLSADEAERIKRFLEASRRLTEEMRLRREGKPLSPSWPLIRRAREQRSKRL
ncbi:MAG: helix-turn-helix domain-containing protein [Chloroflexi bacterium]|nr:helix-turn-helix domain-containing protein [Chloroflexota bacterium]